MGQSTAADLSSDPVGDASNQGWSDDSSADLTSVSLSQPGSRISHSFQTNQELQMHQVTSEWQKKELADMLPPNKLAFALVQSNILELQTHPLRLYWLLVAPSFSSSPSLLQCWLRSGLPFVGNVREGGTGVGHCCLDRQSRDAMEPNDSPCFFCWESSDRRCSSSWQADRIVRSKTILLKQKHCCVWFLLSPAPTEPVYV